MNRRRLSCPTVTMACINCTAWRPWGDIAQCDERGADLGRMPLGQCRAAPPVIDPAAIGNPNATWPVVRADDWCRSFQLRQLDAASAERQPGGHPHEEGRPGA